MGCVTIKLSEDLHSKDLKNISMMSFCLKCQVMTPSVIMQKDTWCLSFGKYLEMRFHGHSYRRRKLNIAENFEDTVLDDNIPECVHSLHRDHIQYFSYKGIVASIIYTAIDTWDVYLPPLYILMENSKNSTSLVSSEDVKLLSMKGHEVFATIYDKLVQILGDMNDPISINLKLSVNNDQFQFKEKINCVQTQLTENKINAWKLKDAYILAKRNLTESIDVWNQRISDILAQNKLSKNDNSNSTITQPNILQRPPSIDAATICTEQLKSEVESSTNEGFEPNNSYETSNDANQGKVSNDIFSFGEHQTKSFGDKKSVKDRLREFLPSDKNIQYFISSPISSNEHYSLPIGRIPLTVHDQDLSSIIAYSLTSNDYQKILDSLNFCEVPKKNVETPMEYTDGETYQRRNSKSTAHVEINFQDSSTQFSCKIYFARDFDAMRAKCLRLSSENVIPNLNEESEEYLIYVEKIRDAFVRSMSQSVQWEARGGKSGSKFCKTLGTFLVFASKVKYHKLNLFFFCQFLQMIDSLLRKCLRKSLQFSRTLLPITLNT